MEEQNNRIKAILVGCMKMQRASQKELYREFYAYGMSICLRYADSREEAAEILNDAFMKIFTGIKKFDLDRPFKPWLRTIVVNTAINYYHKKERIMQADEIEKASHESDHEDILAGISYQEIIQMLQKLPQAYRTVFNLYVIEGYKHEEIAGMLGITTGTSKSNLFKAREILKKILNNFFEVDYVRN